MGFYLEGRADLGRGAATATVTHPCFCFFSSSPPPPFTTSYQVGGASLFFGFELRLSKPASKLFFKS